jgi:myo-inositol-1(or 4)-monophosphatase
MAAGIVLIREAGGVASGPTGGADMLTAGAIVAGNEAIHKALLASLKDAKA